MHRYISGTAAVPVIDDIDGLSTVSLYLLCAFQERLSVEEALHHPWIMSLAQSSQNIPLPVTLMANLKVIFLRILAWCVAG